ncbi:MAG: 50S ribosomal protein LX [Thermoproteales archaeon]|nr:50S ribosomal protein LX [Thermoproteales archaeon]
MSTEIKVYRITGEMKFKTGFTQRFKIEVRALTEKHALEKIYSILGSRHKLKRNHIKIEEIKEINPEEVENQYVKEFISLEKIVKI